LAIGAALGGWLLWPASAIAHLRSGTIAVDYRVSVASPRTRAYTAQIQQSDHTLRLTVLGDHVVVVVGYLGEPVARVDDAGTWINAASPTAVAVGLLPKSQARDGTSPTWQLHPGQRSVSWRDARVAQLPAGVRASPWSVPLLVDGHRAALHGRLARYPAPSLIGWGLLLAALLACGVTLAVLRHDAAARAVALAGAGLGGVVCLVLALGFALDVDASPGTWIEAFNEIVFIAVGVILLIRGREVLRAGAAIGLGLVSLAVGLLDSAVFVHPVVLSLLPGALTRLLVVLAGAAGIVAVGLGGLGYAYLLHAGLESDLDRVRVT